MTKNRFLIGSLVVILFIGILLFLKIPRGSNTASTATTTSGSRIKTYQDPQLGISFQYPAEWGDFEQVGSAYFFTQKQGVTLSLNSYDGSLDLSKKCPAPYEITTKTIDGVAGKGYCRLFERDGRYLYYFVRVGKFPGEDPAAEPLRLTEHAWLNLPNGKGLAFMYDHREAGDLLKEKSVESVLKSFQDGTLDSTVEVASQEFLSMVLSLKIK